MATKPKTTTTATYDTLSDETKAVMDRAVRASRNAGWCDRFTTIAAEVFGVPLNEVIDSDGFSCDGRDREGYDKDGLDRNGLDREGYNRDGFNKVGRDREGYDRYGFNKEGLDRDGRDKYKYDQNGYDQEGYSWTGERRRATRTWYTQQAARPETDFCYDRDGSKRPVKRVAKKATTPAKELVNDGPKTAPAKKATAPKTVRRASTYGGY